MKNDFTYRCPHCGTLMIPEHASAYYYCPNEDKVFSKLEIQSMRVRLGPVKVESK